MPLNRKRQPEATVGFSMISMLTMDHSRIVRVGAKKLWLLWGIWAFNEFHMISYLFRLDVIWFRMNQSLIDISNNFSQNETESTKSSTQPPTRLASKSSLIRIGQKSTWLAWSNWHILHLLRTNLKPLVQDQKLNQSMNRKIKQRKACDKEPDGIKQI